MFKRRKENDEKHQKQLQEIHESVVKECKKKLLNNPQNNPAGENLNNSSLIPLNLVADHRNASVIGLNY